VRWPNPNSRKPDVSLHPRTSAKRLEARLSITPPSSTSLRSITSQHSCAVTGKSALADQTHPSETLLYTKAIVRKSNRSHIGPINNACQVFFASGGPSHEFSPPNGLLNRAPKIDFGNGVGHAEPSTVQFVARMTESGRSYRPFSGAASQDFGHTMCDTSQCLLTDTLFQ
jgi:hypothetical protein